MSKDMQKKITQLELLKEYFMKYPNKHIKHPEVVDWVTSEWEKMTGEKFRDPDRCIRSLAHCWNLCNLGLHSIALSP